MTKPLPDLSGSGGFPDHSIEVDRLQVRGPRQWTQEVFVRQQAISRATIRRRDPEEPDPDPEPEPARGGRRHSGVEPLLARIAELLRDC
jgi:hypothetical protein